jgi:hypothetical protein
MKLTVDKYAAMFHAIFVSFILILYLSYGNGVESVICKVKINSYSVL